jgi:hypothetical protein
VYQTQAGGVKGKVKESGGRGKVVGVVSGGGECRGGGTPGAGVVCRTLKRGRGNPQKGVDKG